MNMKQHFSFSSYILFIFLVVNLGGSTAGGSSNLPSSNLDSSKIRRQRRSSSSASLRDTGVPERSNAQETRRRVRTRKDLTPGAEEVQRNDLESSEKAEKADETEAAPRIQEANSLIVSVVTWNMAEASPSTKDVSFLSQVAAKSDLLCVGAQEIENLKPRRHEGSRSREWRRLLHSVLRKEYVQLGHHSMGAIHLSVLARRTWASRMKLVKLYDVPCGVGNVLQNKGAVAAFLRVDKTTFLLTTAHLAAHQDKVAERNVDYWRIVSELEQEVPSSWVARAEKRKRKIRASSGQEASVQSYKGLDRGTAMESQSADGERRVLLGLVDRAFFFGDLNYRVDLSRVDLERLLPGSTGELMPDVVGVPNQTGRPRRRKRSSMDFDQLTAQRAAGSAFVGFSEGRVTFPPTYKYDKGKDTYDSSKKMRVPAWTDRILYAPHQPAVELLDYSSVLTARHSDHRPVVGTFKVSLSTDDKQNMP